MPRSFAQISTGIWRQGSPFRQLTPAEFGVYMLLETQPDITAAGVLSLTERRWAKLLAETTATDIGSLVAALARQGLVVVDEDTEELLLVPFIEQDKGYNNSRRVPVIADAARAVASQAIREAIAAEVAGLGLLNLAAELLPDSPSHRASDTPSDRPPPDPPDRPSGPGGNSPPDTPPDRASASDRVGVTEVGQIPNPQPATQGRGTGETAWAVPADAEPPATCPDHPDGTSAPCSACGLARRRNQAWHADRDTRIAAEHHASIQARRDCTRCNEQGLLEHPTTHAILGRCDHQPVEPEARTA